MGEQFTDNTDNIFSDIENPVQETQTPADSSDNSNSLDTSATDTGNTERADVPETPAPVPEQTPEQMPVSGEDVKEDIPDNTFFCTCNIDGIYTLLSDLRAENKEYQTSVAEYQTQTMENQTYMIEQSRNILTVSSLLLLTVGFLSGILLARIVWRKL